MEKITGATTLVELAIRRAKYGVVILKLEYYAGLENPVRALLITEHDEQSFVGRGDTEAEALDDAFARVMHHVGAQIVGTR